MDLSILECLSLVYELQRHVTFAFICNKFITD